jgi:hypothetical protein
MRSLIGSQRLMVEIWEPDLAEDLSLDERALSGAYCRTSATSTLPGSAVHNNCKIYFKASITSKVSELPQI